VAFSRLLIGGNVGAPPTGPAYQPPGGCQPII
jgi:hypothetical protein